MVRFLNKAYDIPEDLDKYLELLAFIENMRDGLILSVRQKVKLSEGLIDDEEMMPVFKEHIGKVIQMLCDSEIYDRTVDDYLSHNEGFKLFSQANQGALEAFKKYLMDEFTSFVEGMQDAKDRALSSVTGSPVKVYTSSFLTLAASAAYDYSCAKDQHIKADTQYKKELEFISTAGSSIRERNENNYLNETYFPNIESAMSVFAFSVMDQYISDLIQAKKFNEDALKYVDYKKSQGLLDNLSLSSNKNPILENAFLACPFNPSVYEEAARLGLCDIETLKTANRYCPDNKVTQKIIDECEIKNNDCKFSDEYNRITSFLPIVASQLKQSESEAARTMFKIPYNFYKELFLTYTKIINHPTKPVLKQFALDNIVQDHTTLYSKSIEQIHSDVIKCIEKDIKAENYTFLCELGYEFDELKGIPTSQSIIEYWANVITNIITEYISECKIKHDNLMILKEEFDQNIQRKSEAISLLEQELSTFGIFAFSKKRETKENIEKAKSDLYNYSKQAEYLREFSIFEKHYI